MFTVSDHLSIGISICASRQIYPTVNKYSFALSLSIFLFFYWLQCLSPNQFLHIAHTESERRETHKHKPIMPYTFRSWLVFFLKNWNNDLYGTMIDVSSINDLTSIWLSHCIHSDICLRVISCTTLNFLPFCKMY